MLVEKLGKGRSVAVVDRDCDRLRLAADRRRPHHNHIRHEAADRAGKL